MTSIEIVKLRHEHLERLMFFFSQIDSLEYAKDFSPHPFDEEYARFVCHYEGKDAYYAVLLDEEEIVAYCMMRGWDEGYEIPSLGLCVLKRYQGFGLGSAIMNFLEASSRLRGCSKVMLKVKKDNAAARNLYAGQGYSFKEHNEDFLVGFKDISEGTST